MKKRHAIVLILSLIFLNACYRPNHKTQIISKCTILGDEVKQYGTANYLTLFHSINPDKFKTSYLKMSHFDNPSHRAMINTYIEAVERIQTKDPIAQQLILATKKIANFTQNFVDYDYAKALKHRSHYDPKSDDFFVEINNIVKFDPMIKGFDNKKNSFKGLLATYNQYLVTYKNQ